MPKAPENQLVKLVIDGGQRQMDAPTVPIRWFVSDDILDSLSNKQADKRWHLLISEQTAEEADEAENYGCRKNGRRYLVPITDAVFYLQLYSPGTHIIRAILCGSKKAGKNWLEKSRGYYYEAIYDRMIDHELEIEIPEALFAKKPQSWLGKLWWGFINLAYEQAPLNECAFRRRVMLMPFTHPLALLLIAFMGIIGSIISLYVLFGSLLVLLLGWRPGSLKDNLCCVWSFESKDICLRAYRYWLLWDIDKQKYLPFPPILLLVLLAIATGAGYVVYMAVTVGGIWLAIAYLLAWVIGGGLGVLLISMTMILLGKILVNPEEKAKKLQAKLKAKKAAEAVKEERLVAEKAAYLQWLRETLGSNAVVDKVDVDAIVLPPRDRFVFRVRVGYNQIKARICRPYAR